MRRFLLGTVAVSLLSGLGDVGAAAPPENLPARTADRARPDRGGRPDTPTPPATRPAPPQASAPTSRPEPPGRPQLPTASSPDSGRQRAEQIREQLRDARLPERAANAAVSTPQSKQAERLQVDRRNVAAAQSRERRPGGVVEFLFGRFGRERRAIAEVNKDRRDNLAIRDLPSASRRGTDAAGQVRSESRPLEPRDNRRDSNLPLPRADRQLAQRLAQIDGMRDRAIVTGNDQLLTVADQLEAIARQQHSRRTAGLEPLTDGTPPSSPGQTGLPDAGRIPTPEVVTPPEGITPPVAIGDRSLESPFASEPLEEGSRTEQ